MSRQLPFKRRRRDSDKTRRHVKPAFSFSCRKFPTFQSTADFMSYTQFSLFLTQLTRHRSAQLAAVSSFRPRAPERPRSKCFSKSLISSFRWTLRERHHIHRVGKTSRTTCFLRSLILHDGLVCLRPSLLLSFPLCLCSLLNVLASR